MYVIFKIMFHRVYGQMSEIKNYYYYYYNHLLDWLALYLKFESDYIQQLDEIAGYRVD